MLNALLLPAAIYLVIVSICISNRITKRTKLRMRLMAIGIGSVGAWALSRSVMFQWQITPTDLSLAVAVIGCAIIMAFFPRVRV